MRTRFSVVAALTVLGLVASVEAANGAPGTPAASSGPRAVASAPGAVTATSPVAGYLVLDQQPDDAGEPVAVRPVVSAVAAATRSGAQLKVTVTRVAGTPVLRIIAPAKTKRVIVARLSNGKTWRTSTTNASVRLPKNAVTATITIAGKTTTIPVNRANSRA